MDALITSKNTRFTIKFCRMHQGDNSHKTDIIRIAQTDQIKDQFSYFRLTFALSIRWNRLAFPFKPPQAKADSERP